MTIPEDVDDIVPITHNQYVVIAQYKGDDDVVVQRIMLVTDDIDKARAHNVSAYENENDWIVFIEHSIVDDTYNSLGVKRHIMLHPVGSSQ